MPLIWQLPRANSLSLLMDAEMLLITHIHQPIVALQPSEWMMLSRATWPPNHGL